MVKVRKIMATSFKYPLHTLPHSVPLTLQQATADPRLCQKLLDTHRQVWVSLLWAQCSFHLGPGAHKVLFVPSKSLFPQSCVSSYNQIPLASKVKFPGVFSPFVRSPGWEICCKSHNFLHAIQYQKTYNPI